MSVIYKGKVPNRNYAINDFYDYGIVVSWWTRWKDYKNIPCCRIIFRSNGLLAEIRKCGKTWAIDVQWGWSTDQRQCLTTECKNLKEAKSILFLWFKEKGFSVSEDILKNDWRKATLRYTNIQLKMFTKL